MTNDDLNFELLRQYYLKLLQYQQSLNASSDDWEETQDFINNLPSKD